LSQVALTVVALKHERRDLRYKLLRPFKKVLGKALPVAELDQLVESVPGVGLRLNVPGNSQVIAGPGRAA
jgi:hypothetical protein